MSDLPSAADEARAALPPAFVERLGLVVPPEHLGETLASFVQTGRVGLRANGLRTSADALYDELSAAGLDVARSAVPGALLVPTEQRAALMETPAYAEGRAYLQNVASQLPPHVLAPEPGDRVLDLCAAPGSKTGQLAAMVGEEGEVTAVEVVRKRYYKLRANLDEQGAAGPVHAVNADGAQFWRREPESYDRVLLDAPCSTEGRFRAEDPETFRYWSPRKVKEMRQKQRKLLFGAVQALRPGGTLVYATCTFEPAENEDVLAKALRQFGVAVELVPLDLPASTDALRWQAPLTEWNGRALPEALAPARRLLPEPERGTEAFFVAKLVKRASTLR
jgi:16S rRNA (cytosine1407-C5)-methyltransferase